MAQKEINPVVFIDKKSNVLAYYPTCEVVVFNGSDKKVRLLTVMNFFP